MKLLWYILTISVSIAVAQDLNETEVEEGTARPQLYARGKVADRKEIGYRVQPITKCTGKRANPTKYDSLILALTWTPGQCFQNKDCGIGISDMFALHGLWPTKARGDGPNCCTDTVRFFQDDVTYKNKETKHFLAVKAIVKKRMVSLYKATSSGEGLFHQYEWTKHGTCAVASNPELNDTIPYFEKMLELDTKVDAENLLKNAKIAVVPDLQVELSRIVTPIESKVNKQKIQVRCRQFESADKKSTVYLLHEIRICFKPDASTPVNCPNVPRNSQCGQYVYLKLS